MKSHTNIKKKLVKTIALSDIKSKKVINYYLNSLKLQNKS